MLRGELRYSSTPASVGNMPDQPLVGKTQVIKLSEMGDAETLETELEFTGMPGPRGGARVRVVSSTTDVQLQGVAITPNRVYDLHDADVLTVGGYSLIYENLLATRPLEPAGMFGEGNDAYDVSAGPVYDKASDWDGEVEYDDYYTEPSADGYENASVKDDYGSGDESSAASPDDYDFGDGY